MREVGHPRCPAAPPNADPDAPLSPAEENEERTMIDPTSKEDPKFKELVKVRRGVCVGMIFSGQVFWGACPGGKRSKSWGLVKGP